jgi:hypothetical protein
MAFGKNISATNFVSGKQYSPVQEPWTYVIGDKTYSYVVCLGAVNIASDANNVPTDRIFKIIRASPCTTNDIESVLDRESDIFTFPF